MSQNEGFTYDIFDQKIDGRIEIKKWVGKDLDKFAVEYANKFGQYLVNQKLSTSQIRNVFGEVRRIQMKILNGDWKNSEASVLLLRPKLAYAAKRSKSKAAVNLEKLLSEGILEITRNENDTEKMACFQRFADFFEAVLAYHKAHGGD